MSTVFLCFVCYLIGTERLLHISQAVLAATDLEQVVRELQTIVHGLARSLVLLYIITG